MSENIYQVYFLNNWQIKIIQDLEFDRKYNYEEIGIIAIKKPLFFYSKLELFTDNTYNIFVKKEEKLSAIPFSLSITYPKVEDDNSNYFSSTFSNNNILSL